VVLLDEDFGFMLAEHVEHDDQPPDDAAFGDLMRRVHALPAPPGRLVAQVDATLERTLAGLLVRRGQLLSRLAGIEPPPLQAEAAARTLAFCSRRRSLLHLDARPANVLAEGGRVRALIDWSNALTGDPVLELYRIDEYGHLTPGFLEGYRQPGWADGVPEAVEVLCRLYTATMLSIVFLTAAPDGRRAAATLSRVRELYARWRRCGETLPEAGRG
jgi:aminoglycoside phosphotransferase (APT) family kinase protein